MQRIHLISVVLSILALGASQANAAPDPTPDANASVVHLRTNCDVAGIPKENCFESMANLMAWTWTTRNPSASDRLRIDAGPGQFGAFECPNGRGWVSLYGSGRLTTVFEGTASSTPAGRTVGGEVSACEDLEFADATFRGTWTGFHWIIQGGSSQWQSVDIEGLDSGQDGAGFNETFAWLEEPGGCNEESPIASHYFFDTRVIAHGSRNFAYDPAPFWTGCSDVWFYGGEITWNAAPVNHLGGLVDIGRRSKMHVFGSALRVLSTTPGDYSGLVGIRTTHADSVYHMHGGIVSMQFPEATSGYAFGIYAHPGSLVHTPGTAFAMNGNLLRFRIAGTGTVQSPFLWQSGQFPPAASSETNVINSQSGSDMYVETDCDSGGNCNGAGSETHLMIYNSNLCPLANPWFDTQTGACRL